MSLADQATPFIRQAATVLVTGADTGGRLALVETVEVQGAEPPCHCHHWEDETLYVLEGELIIYRAGTAVYAPVGAAVVLPRAIEHSFVVLTATARVLTMLAPAGFEAWYGEAEATTLWNGDLDRIVATAARYGCEITGPRPSHADAPSIVRELT
jgi:quercetin dioxygenase-like cupin family protein